jgi:hypothetical protein
MTANALRKHLTTAQRIRLIEDYIKASFSSDGENTYIVPPKTLPHMAQEASGVLGFTVNDNNIAGCFKIMGEMGFTLIRQRAPAKNKSKHATLQGRVDQLEMRVLELETQLHAMRDA